MGFLDDLKKMMQAEKEFPDTDIVKKDSIPDEELSEEQ